LTNLLNKIYTDLLSNQKLLYDLLDTLIHEVQVYLSNLIISKITNLSNQITGTKNALIRYLAQLFSNIETKLSELQSNLESFISRSLSETTNTIKDLLNIQSAEILDALIIYYDANLFPILAGISVGISEVLTEATFILKETKEILGYIKDFPTLLENKLEDQTEVLKDFLNEWKKDLIK
jgi:hypothetical protein